MRSVLSLGLDRSPFDFLVLVLRMGCCPILMTTIELLARPAIIGDTTLMSWEVGRLRHPYLSVGRFGKICDALMRPTIFLPVLWLRALLAGALLIAPSAWLLNPAVVATMTAFLILWSKRSIYGQDGADQMLLIIWLAALVAVGVGGETAVRLCLWFIAYQCCMAYTVAGFAKVTAAGWRGGQFLPGVLGTKIYGTQFVGGFLRHHRRLAVAGSWVVLLFEMGFPLAWLLPWPWGIAYLVLGGVFHLSNAFLMGLGSFLATFVATYPAVWFTLERKGW